MSEQTGNPAAEAPARKALIQTVTGRVTSDKMNKTVTVLVERRVKHPIYDKVVIKSNKYHAHDEANACKTGDLVEIQAARKLSKIGRASCGSSRRQKRSDRRANVSVAAPRLPRHVGPAWPPQSAWDGPAPIAQRPQRSIRRGYCRARRYLP